MYYPSPPPRTTHVPTLEKWVEGLVMLGMKGILRFPVFLTIFSQRGKKPLIRENGQKTKQSAKKTYQAPQAKNRLE